MISVNKMLLSTGVILAVCSQPVSAVEWVKNYDAATYLSSGTITFNDWGYTGPGGRTYNDFAPINGFGGAKEGNALDPSGGIGQVQHVVTTGPDGRTRDATSNIQGDFARGYNSFDNANMDSAVNFYQWGYTTKAGSRFDKMKIDYDGDYLVNQNDMNFEFYDNFTYQQVGTSGSLPDGVYTTGLAFQPYALSDATGWCGSVMAQHPSALEAMAGQVTFDFAFDVYFQGTDGSLLSYFSTEIVRGFKMTSYGDYTVNITTSGGDVQSYSSSAIVNNTNPDPAAAPDADNPLGFVDPDQYNLVSFHGADVLSAEGKCGILNPDWSFSAAGAVGNKFTALTSDTDQASCEANGGTWQTAAFAGYAFIMRADGIRVVEAVDYDQYTDLPDLSTTSRGTVIDGVVYNMDENGNLVAISDLSAVPVPAAVWLFGSGLLGLLGVARRRKA